MNHNNKRFIVLMLFVSLFITNIFGVCQQEFWASAKTDTKKYYVKEKYMRDLGKNLKYLRKNMVGHRQMENMSFGHSVSIKYLRKKSGIHFRGIILENHGK